MGERIGPEVEYESSALRSCDIATSSMVSLYVMVGFRTVARMPGQNSCM